MNIDYTKIHDIFVTWVKEGKLPPMEYSYKIYTDLDKFILKLFDMEIDETISKFQDEQNEYLNEVRRLMERKIINQELNVDWVESPDALTIVKAKIARKDDSKP